MGPPESRWMSFRVGRKSVTARQLPHGGANSQGREHIRPDIRTRNGRRENDAADFTSDPADTAAPTYPDIFTADFMGVLSLKFNAATRGRPLRDSRAVVLDMCTRFTQARRRNQQPL
ncbi:unnamed protein product, partial [Iphiclides podalirius]